MKFQLIRIMWLMAAMLCCPAASLAQSNEGGTPASSRVEPLDVTNPVSILQYAGRALPNSVAAAPDAVETAKPGELGYSPPGESRGDNVGLSTPISIVLLLTVLSLAPALLVLTTSFTRIVIVLSLLRQAIGTQALPPSQVIVGLSLFLTFLVMAPTFDRINREALVPMQNNEIDQFTAWNRAKQPMRDFMFAQIEHAGNWSDIYLMLNYRGVDTSQPEKLTRADVDMISLIPAYVLSELKIAFLIAFRLYLPFLIVDMVVSSVLISMGMLMLPPVLISLPFKLLLFVLVDGWTLVAGNLLNSFAVPGVTT